MAGPLHASDEERKYSLTVHIAQELHARATSTSAFDDSKSLPSVILMSDENRVREPVAAMRGLPPSGAFLFRHYNDPYREQTGQYLRSIAHKAGIAFFVAGDPELAVRLEADGFHLPEYQLEIAERGSLPDFPFLSAATHSRHALERAASLGLDAAILSPVFATRSHPDAEPLGPAAAMRLAANAELPVFALGGVNDTTAPLLSGSAFAGFAGIEGLSQA